MKGITTYLTVLFVCIAYYSIYSQEKLEVEGAIIIQNSEDPAPAAGTIRWTGADFEGWNGSYWISLTGGTIKDIDNNSYRVVTIGTQTWMAENLRVAHYNDGTAIPLVTVNTAWQDSSNAGNPAYTWYNNGNYVTGYGAPAPEYSALYNWYAIDILSNGNRNVCPTGWHVPSDAEWTNLTNHLGGASVAGGKIKETGLGHWNNDNTGATNESGFSEIPGGYRFDNGVFSSIGSSAGWWSSLQSGDDAWLRLLYNSDDNVYRDVSAKGWGLSVRCLRDSN